MKKAGWKGADFFSVDFNPIDTSDVLDIYKYLMKVAWYKKMFKSIKKIFIGLLISIANTCNHKK